MKKFLLLFLVALSFSASAQFGISYHQSEISFAGFNYTIKNKLIFEARISTNLVSEDLYEELVASYVFANKDDYQIYAGIGGTSGFDGGFVLPAGMNIYPFESKKFGFHTELAYLFVDGGILRGTFGLRYRFLK